MEQVNSKTAMRERGKAAQDQNITAGLLIYEIIKTTLGPKGMDKLLIDSAGRKTATNDGVTILEKWEFPHPAGQMIVEAARTQEDEIGDGTTTVAMLAGKLLVNAGKLLDKGVHPTNIIKGYNLARTKSVELLEELSIKKLSNDQLKQISKTALTGKGAEEYKELLSDLVVKAVLSAEKRENIKIERIKGKSITNTELIEGMVIDRPVLLDSMPKKVINPKILLLDFELEIKKPEMDITAQVSSPEEMNKFADSDTNELKKMALKIIASGANVVIAQKGMADDIQHMLAEKNIMAMRRTAKPDIEHIAEATNAKIASKIEDVDQSILGTCESIEEDKQKEGSLVFIRGCKNSKSRCLLLHATTIHVLDELRRAVTDALGDVFSCYNEKRAVPGGGAIEMALSKRLNEYSNDFQGREQLAIKQFADALESIPEALAENAGLDSIQTLTSLRNAHEKNLNFGLDLFTNKIHDVIDAGIIEPTKIKEQAISSATEVVTQILRIDDILQSKTPNEN